jgi:hypothetical protein
MATDKWLVNGSGNWNTAANWSNGVPTSTSNVVVTVGNPDVTTGITITSLDNSGSVDFTDAGASNVSGTLTNTDNLDIDTGYENGGSTLSVAGTLINDGTIDIGTGGLTAASTITAAALDNYINANLGTINLTGNTSVKATLHITGAAGFGGATAGVLYGSVTLSGDALLEFTSGQITTIGADSGLTLNGSDVFVADASNTSSNSALTGLTRITGSLALQDIAPLTTTGALTNTGNLNVDTSYEAGGSTLHIGGALTNDGNIDIGTGGLSAATTVTATGLDNYINTNLGTINITGNTSVKATLDITGTAGFGGATAGVLYGTANLSGDALLEFASGQITTIGANSGLAVNGSDAFVADASNTSSNSALTGLTRIAGGLNLEDIAPLTTTGALTNTNELQVDAGYQAGGSTLHIGGALTNDGTVDIGTGGLSAATTVTATALTNYIGTNLGTINLTGNTDGGLPVPVVATLDIAGAAGFGTASMLTGTVNLSGDALLEFASSQITTIAANSGLNINGPDAFLADASNTSSNSALTGLTTITGGLNLEDIAPLTTTGALTNTNELQVDTGYQAGGSTLHIGGALTNDGTVDIGTGGLSASTTVTATALTNFIGTNLGTINLTGNTDTGLPVPVVATFDIASAAGFGTASVLTGTVVLGGDALLEFASGQITTIGFDSGLTLNGPDAFVADASNRSANSALTGLTRITGGLNLEGIAPLTTTGALTNTGNLDVDTSYQAGGSTLHIGGALTNDGTVDIGTGGLSASTMVTTTALTNYIGTALGAINLTGNTSGALPVPVVATFDIASAAGFGTASMLTGTVVLGGDALLEFASGQITTIAADSGLTLSGPDAFVADASNTSSNSALTGLTRITGGLNLEGIAPLTTTGALTNTGNLDVDTSYQAGGSTLHIGGVLTNDGTVDIGTGGLSAATTVTATGLNNYISANLGTLNLTGNTSVKATLDITGTAGFGGATAGLLYGAVTLSGDALLEFASGQITTIDANSGLTLSGPDAFVADASNTSSNSALTGLTRITGGLNLEDIAPLTTTGALTNTGNLDVDTSYQAGGSTLHIGGALTNDGTVDIGTAGLSAATTVTATGLDNASTGTINVTGNSNSDFQALLTVNGTAVNDGTMNIAASAEVAVAAGDTYDQAGGTTTVAGTLSAGSIVVSGGTLELLDGARTSGDTTVKAGGTLELYGGAVTSGTITLASGSTEELLSGYTASGFTVSSGVTLEIGSGATAVAPTISGGTLELNAGAVVSGAITFAGTSGVLQINATTMPGNTISGFAPGETIDLRGVAFQSTGTVTLAADNLLKIVENGHTYDLQLNPSQSFTGDVFALKNDGQGGTDITDPTISRGVTIAGGANEDIIAAPHDTILGGNNDVFDLSRLTAATGGAVIEDLGTRITDTVVGFSDGVDRLSFAGETGSSEASVLASVQVRNGNTVLTYPDHSTITLIGISHPTIGIFT